MDRCFLFFCFSTSIRSDAEWKLSSSWACPLMFHATHCDFLASLVVVQCGNNFRSANGVDFLLWLPHSQSKVLQQCFGLLFHRFRFPLSSRFAFSTFDNNQSVALAMIHRHRQRMYTFSIYIQFDSWPERST